VMAEADGPAEGRERRDAVGAIVIALVYTLAGPLIGAVLVVPFATIAAAEFGSGTLAESLTSVLSALPCGFVLSYGFAGALALVTGIVIAAVAYRRGSVSAWMAIVAPTLVFVGFAILHRFVHIEIPGTAILRGGGQGGMLLWLAVCIASSLICWLVTLPLQRRSA